MFPRHLGWLAGSLSLALTAACSGTGTTPSDGSGGVVGAGGAATGGVGASTGGAVGSGGGVGTGGAATGGAGVTGGAPSTGGAFGTGGVATGGAPGSGGEGSGGEPPVSLSDLPPAPGPGNVPKPAGTPDGITVLDWAGFPAAVTFSFDDNDGSQLMYYDQMRAIGGRFTYYLVSDWGLTDAKWKTIFADGNEIGNHTTNHSCGTSQIEGAKTAIGTEFGKDPTTVAAPNGDDNCQTSAQGRAFINREVGPATPVTPLSNVNPFAMNCYIPGTGQAAGQYVTDLNGALNQHGWVIYVIHGINPGTTHTFQPVSWDGLKGGIEHAIDNDMWVDTMENIGAYWLGQKQFASAVSETSGDSTTWTWTLPNQFPSGKYLRVTVAGGTLSQGGVPLAWDPRGYYEIALDELSVTLGP